MDRLNQLKSEAGKSEDSTLDTSLTSEAYLTANDSSKYFSLLEEESSFTISKDTVNPEQEATVSDDPLISNLSPIPKTGDLDSYKIGKQIEAANILSGGVNIFDDNDNSYDGDELVIDDNVTEVDEKINMKGKLNEEDANPFDKIEDNLVGTIDDAESAIPSKDTEVVLQIDGKNVDAIDIGNGLYLYRKEGEEELAAVQIVDDNQQQSSFKFLKVRENAEGNLEVYEEIEIEVPKEVQSKEGKSAENVPHVPIKDISKVINEPIKVDERLLKTPPKDAASSEVNVDLNKESQSESKTEFNINGKTMKFSESRKSPVVGSFTPMTFHSTPNKEGIPLTKTMVNQQLHPSRHSDNVKKTIEVHTDSSKQRILDTTVKNNKDVCDLIKTPETIEKESKVTSEQKSEDAKHQVEQDILEDKETNKFIEENKVEDIIKISLEVDKPANDFTKQDKAITQVAAMANEANSQSQDNKKALDIGSTISVITGNQEVLESCEVKDSLNVKENYSKDPITIMSVSNENNSAPDCKNITVESVCTKKIDNIVSNITSVNKVDVEFLDPVPDESVIAKNIADIYNKEAHSIQDTKYQSANKTKSVNIETPNCESDVAISDHHVQLEAVKIGKDTIETAKGVLNAEIKSVDLKSNQIINANEEENIKSKDSMTKNFTQIEISKNNKNKQIDSRINIEKPIELASNDKIIESKLSLEPNESKNERHPTNEKSETSQLSNTIQSSIKDEAKKELPKGNKNVGSKPVINNNAAVPFGKWTEANRQEFLNKIKETKAPTNNSNTKQIKQPNDLNRRDILQKIDSQRQQQSNNAMAKVQEQQKLQAKNETSAFVKSAIKHDTKIPTKERPSSKIKPICIKKNSKEDPSQNLPNEPSTLLSNSNKDGKKESLQRREINNQALIDKTIEDIINRVPPVKTTNEDRKQNAANMEGIEKQKGMTLFGPSYHAQNEQSVTLDEIEMKMNELHGIPFVERPAHELPQKFTVDNNTLSSKNESHKSKPVKVPNLLPFGKKTQAGDTEEVVNIDSDDEIIERLPITGDVNQKQISIDVTEKVLDSKPNQVQEVSDGSKKDVIITEKDFDKFFRRNSFTYENCLTVNFDGKEQHNVVQTLVEKDIAPKKLTRNEVLLAESKAKSTHKQQMLQARHNNHPTKIPTSVKYQSSEEESYGKNYQSKLQIAYQSALTAKRQKESPIPIIEEKPVKVVFMDSNNDFLPSQLNVQGEKLSPIKQFTPDLETFTHSTTDSLDSDILDNFDSKSQDELRVTKSRHQRKQVLTPVDMAEMELIEPGDLGIEVSQKKKRKIEETFDRSPKNHVPKKSYLLGRTNIDDKTRTLDVGKISFKEITNHNNSFVGHSNPISAIDNLVKAAELLDNQAENNSNSTKTQDSDSQQNTPIKRGRGRPRKYPLPDGEADKNKAPSPQKKPRLIDAKVVKREESDEDNTSDDEIIKENWTMGKINENIVCPICNKLFRSENVVFKHVKHCTGPSPNRSESDKRRLRQSQGSETRSLGSNSDDMDVEEQEIKSPKKRKSKESISKVSANSDEVIIEETRLKEKPVKQHESRKSTVKTKIVQKPNNNLVCEICGKSFRQSSYLAHHKLQHQNDELKKKESDSNVIKSVFSCEVCKKEFRKLHHLVQHRAIHNPNTAPARSLRKSSSEHGDNKIGKDQTTSKPTEDLSAGFRCEPCDKSFRKLHHLVEHRETHDGINRQKATEVESVKPPPIHQCDICGKTFKKLQLLNEHKEQHLETCSEKSDDKSVKSSLSTKDIIHECSLCYMVFPNEHSLNKHTVICLKKKKQSAAKAKQAALRKETEKETLDSENPTLKEYALNDADESLIIVEVNANPDHTEVKEIKLNDDKPVVLENLDHNSKNNTENQSKKHIEENNIVTTKFEPLKKIIDPKEKASVNTITEMLTNKVASLPAQIPTYTKQSDDNIPLKVKDTPVPKKKTPAKDKIATTVTKRQSRTVNVPLPVIDDIKPSIESSDEDEIRYMLNPYFKEDETEEGKNFMKIKAKKRNSLQIERPSSRDLIKRKTSLQHPPKISRIKKKSLEQKATTPTTSTISKSASAINNKSILESMASTDSDDSDIKYSFPETTKDVATTTAVVKKPQKRKSVTLKRKSISVVAKRKSLGKAINTKHKLNTPPPAKLVKKRTTEVEHRCDCGKLFSSAALLSRHTTLDHTPPRIRRRRSPVPEVDTKTVTKHVTRKSVSAKTTPNSNSKKPTSQRTTDSSKPGVSTRKSSMNNNDAKASSETRKSVKSGSGVKSRRSAAHKGVPVPEKMRKLMDRSKI